MDRKNPRKRKDKLRTNVWDNDKTEGRKSAYNRNNVRTWSNRMCVQFINVMWGSIVDSIHQQFNGPNVKRQLFAASKTETHEKPDINSTFRRISSLFFCHCFFRLHQIKPKLNWQKYVRTIFVVIALFLTIFLCLCCSNVFANFSQDFDHIRFVTFNSQCNNH